MDRGYRVLGWYHNRIYREYLMEITYRRVYDQQGSFKHLELIQGNNVIRLKNKNPLDSGRSGDAWQDVKVIVDSQFKDITKDSYRATS